MTSLLGAFRRRRSVTGDQSGFALLATLVIILATSILVMAVLSLSITTTIFSTQQVQRDRSTRSADSAMETAIAVLRKEGRTLGTQQTNCTHLFPDGSGGFGPSVMGEDGNDVVVDCEALVPGAPIIPTDDKLNSEEVNLVGEDYGSAHGTIDPTTFPWTAALGASAGATASALAANHAALVASGKDPLPFTNPVKVHSTAAVVRDPVTDPGNPSAGQYGPAMTVGAAYTQGDNGPQAVPSAFCGALSPTSATPSTRIVSRPDAPLCGSVAGQSLSADSAEDAGADNLWPAEMRAQRDRSSQVVADCNAVPSGGDPATQIIRRGADLISFPPGAYDVGALNRWLGASSCANKVFWFTPGTYWFGCGPSSVTPSSCDAANGDALRIDNPTSVVVFGAENGWGTPTLTRVRATFPKACNPNLPGVAITLQSRTAIRHDSGQVAICDRSPAGQPLSTAIYQPKRRTPNWPASGDNPPAFSESPAANISGYQNSTFGDLGNLAVPGSVSTATAVCGAPFDRLVWTGWLWGFIPTWGWRTFRDCGNSTAVVQVKSWTNPVPAVTGANPITNVRLRVKGSAANVDPGTQFNLALTRADGSVMCQLSNPSGTNSFNVPGNGASFNFDFTVDLSSACPNVRNLQDLVGVGARLTAQIVPRCNTAWFFGGSNDPTNRMKCAVGDLPRISLDLISLSAKGTDEGAVGAAFRVTSDATDPARPASFNVYGRVSVPLADLDIYWNGPYFRGQNGDMDPLFGGSMYFNGMGSKVKATEAAHTGIVCCAVGQASERRVQLRAFTDLAGTTGVLSGTAIVTLQDWRLATETELGDAGIADSDENRVVVAPGYRARVESWNLCGSGRVDVDSIVARNAAVCRAP